MDLGLQLERRAKLEREIYYTNKEYIGDEPFQDITNLAAKLDKLKSAFMKRDPTSTGAIDYVALHGLAQDLGIMKTLAELKKRVQEITGNTRNVIPYKDCAMAFLGRRSTMCQRIMWYNAKEGYFEKRPCWLDCIKPSYFSHMEFAIHPGLQSPISLIPPPPPPSPADMGKGEKTETYPAA